MYLMYMVSLPVTLRSPSVRTSRRMVVEIDVRRLEKLADALGMYNPDFLASLSRAEADVRAGRVKKVKTLKDLH